MKICLCFHCLCKSYDSAPSKGRELFVSLPDMRDMVEQLISRGYKFSTLEDPSPNTVTITFDDGYYNNRLFSGLSKEYGIPYVIFPAAYYIETGSGFPWFDQDGRDYENMHEFDYYRNAEENGIEPSPAAVPQNCRPMRFEELKEFSGVDNFEIGCHGYYHQPLSEHFEQYLEPEQEQALSVFRDNLDLRPRYFGLANGMYTKRVMRRLLMRFDKVLTIDGRPFKAGDRVIHRLSLVNPNLGGSLMQQIDRILLPLRQLKRRIRTFQRLHF